MTKDLENIDELIAKFLSGECSPDEAIRLEEWKARSLANEDHFEASKKVFNVISGNTVSYPVDVDGAWNKINDKTDNSTKIISFVKRRTALRIAASLMLLVLLGFLLNWFFNETAPVPMVMKASNSAIQKILPDGSKVFINKNSEISFIQTKDGQRHVTLKGEAFFEVVHDEKSPFVIAVNDLLVKDIGTAFNVKENLNEQTVEVFVESGEVQFYTAKNVGLMLVRGNKASYNKLNGSFKRLQNESSINTKSYKTKLFEFNKTQLGEVIAQLNAVYDLNIRVQDTTLSKELLSVKFNNENVDLIINIIAETLDLEMEKTGKIILLKRKSTSR